MNIQAKPSRSQATFKAFTVMEILMALAISGVLFVSLYGGFSSGWMVTELSRENLRATQIMVEKMETIRLYNWSQINTPGFIPRTFVDTYYPSGVRTNERGLSYSGTITMSDCPFSAGYSNTLKKVALELRWTSGGVQHTRTMETLVSRYGLQNYVY